MAVRTEHDAPEGEAARSAAVRDVGGAVPVTLSPKVPRAVSDADWVGQGRDDRARQAWSGPDRWDPAGATGRDVDTNPGAPRNGGADAPLHPLFERSPYLRALRRALDLAGSGTGTAMFFSGEPGVGKSTLLDAAATMSTGFRVLRAWGSPPERELPFAYLETCFAFGSAATPDIGWRAGRSTSVGEPGGPREQPLVTGDARTLLERRASRFGHARAELWRLAEAGPILLLLDDLHWADPDSLALVGYLVRRLRHLPVAVVAALGSWPDGAGAMLRDLRTDVEVRTAPVEALGPAATVRMLESVLGRPLDADTAWRAWSITKGNPTLVHEAARSIALDGDLPHPRGGDGSTLRAGLTLRHLAGLPMPALMSARAIAVVGGPVPLRVCRMVADLDDETFAEAIDTLLMVGVLHDCGGTRVGFVHDAVSSAVYHDMAPARRRLLHQRAFEALRTLRDPEAAAAHAVAADLVGDPAAIDTLTEAGEMAMRAGAVYTGLGRLQAAVELAGAEPPGSLLERHARALFAAGRSGEAYDVWRQILGRSGPGSAAVDDDVLAGVAQAQAFAGDLDGALAAYDDAVDGLGRRGPLPVGLALERAHVLWELGGPVAALEGLPAPTGAEAAAADSQLKAFRAMCRVHAGDRGAMDELDRHAAIARRRLQRTSAAVQSDHTVLFMYAGASVALERFDEAAAIVDEGIARFTAQGALWATAPLHIVRVGMLLRRGRPAEALAAVGEAEACDWMPPLLARYMVAFRAFALAWLGRHDEAAELRSGPVSARSEPWMVRTMMELSEARALAAAGRRGCAAAVHGRIAVRFERMGIGEPGLLPWAADAADAMLADGRLDDVRRLATNLARPEAGNRGAPGGSDGAGKAGSRDGSGPVPSWPLMVADAAMAGVAAATGDTATAERLYARVLALPVVNPLDRATILIRYGSWLRRTRRPVLARAPLGEALAAAEAAGAADLVSAARTELTAAGGRRRRSRTADGELTPQQARVAELAVTGATTGEIARALQVSPRTVESHLAGVYRTFGVRTKAELRQRGLHPAH